MTVNVGMIKLYINCSKRTHADEEIKITKESLNPIKPLGGGGVFHLHQKFLIISLLVLDGFG